MLRCLKQQSSPLTNSYWSSSATQGYSVENTPSSSAQSSPTIDLTREFTNALQTESYREVRRILDPKNFTDLTVDTMHVDIVEEPLLLEEVLQPNRERVQQTLSFIQPHPVTYLVATFFGHSEDTARLCLQIYQSVLRAHLLYTPIHDLLDDLPSEFDSDSYSLSDSQCDKACDLFLKFDSLENPFFSLYLEKFGDVHQCFSDLKQKLYHHVRKSGSKVPVMRYCSRRSALCFVAAGVGVAISAVSIATHLLFAFIGSPICLAFFSSYSKNKKGAAHFTQLDVAARNANYLPKHLDTIKCLVAQLHSIVKSEKQFIQMGLDKRNQSYLIPVILKQVQRNRASFVKLLRELEDHLFRCFADINRSRSLLLHEIHRHGKPG